MTTLAPSPVQADPDPYAAAGDGLGRRLLIWLTSNRLFTAMLVIGLSMRVLVMVAYPPALEFFGDSPSYLQAADHLGHVDIWHPPGYPLLLRVVSVTGSLAVLTALQHLLGLAAAVLVYRLCRRFGVGAVGGTIAALPLLLDCYQVDVEHFVLSETLFTLLLVSAISVALRVKNHDGLGIPMALGALLAALTLTRTVGLFVAVAIALVLLVQRVGARRLMAAAATFLVPVLGYALAFNSTYGAFGLQGYSGRYLYGMVAPYASCSNDELHGAGRILCPTAPTYARPGLNQFVWQSRDYARLPGTDIQRSTVAGKFARRAMLDQPGATVATIARNVAHYFEPGRDTGVRDWFAGSWQFPLPDRAPAWNIAPARTGFHDANEHGEIRLGPARFLRALQNVLYTPGPLVLVALLLALVAACRRRTERATREGVVLLAGTGLLLLIVPSATAGFDWRYLLPAQTLLVPAGVLAARSLSAGLALSRPKWARPKWVRPEWARPEWTRRWRALAVVAAVAVFAATVAASPSVYADQRLRPGTPSAVPSTAVVSPPLRVHVGRPVVLGTQCMSVANGYRTAAVASFPVAASYQGRGSALVEPADFGVAGEDPYQTVYVANPDLPGLLPATVLSSRYQHVAGRLYLRVFGRHGRLVYVDPLAAGAAAWTFQLRSSAITTQVGDKCTPAPPPPLPAPRFARIAPFTTASGQQLAFGPLHQLPPTGTTYDVRWLGRTPTDHAGAWHLPPAWQRTAVRSLTLSNLQAGVTYCFSARTHRPSGKTTAWSVPRCVTRLEDDAALAAKGSWRRFTGVSNFYDGTYIATRQQGASLTAAGTGRRLAVVAYRCPGCGVVDVMLGGSVVRRLNLNSSRADRGVFTWISRAYGKHGRVQLRASGNGLVVIDAIGVQP